MPYEWKPLPSIRTTIHVFGSKISDCSNNLTYSYLCSRQFLCQNSREDCDTDFEFAIINMLRQCSGMGSDKI